MVFCPNTRTVRPFKDSDAVKEMCLCTSRIAAFMTRGMTQRFEGRMQQRFASFSGKGVHGNTVATLHYDDGDLDLE